MKKTSLVSTCEVPCVMWVHHLKSSEYSSKANIIILRHFDALNNCLHMQRFTAFWHDLTKKSANLLHCLTAAVIGNIQVFELWFGDEQQSFKRKQGWHAGKYSCVGPVNTQSYGWHEWLVHLPVKIRLRIVNPQITNPPHNECLWVFLAPTSWTLHNSAYRTFSTASAVRCRWVRYSKVYL